MDTKKLPAAVAALRGEFEERLSALCEIPTVSVEPERKADIRRCAELAGEYLRGLGATVDIVETGGHPIVLGRVVQDAAFPTVSVYNHLDVQPADPAEWDNPPFKLKRVKDRYFARGATDDKGPALAAFYGARLALEAGVRANLQFIWEFEEEIGSPSFEAGLKKAIAGEGISSPFATDSVVVSDTLWIAAGRPAIAYGLRGLMGMSIRLKTGAKDVHSGTTGGAARNPIAELAQLLAECLDARTGRVKIPGFYDDVRKLSAAEKKGLQRAGFSARRFKEANELYKLRPGKDLDLMEAIMTRPTFEVHGLVGGYTGPGIKTIVPHEAELKISTRLVPDQRPTKVFKVVRDFIKKRCPEAEVTLDKALEPYLAEIGGPLNEAAAKAMKGAFGREPAFTREGGSIGAVLTMQELLKAPVIFLGLSLPEHGYHSKNENFDWGQASGGMQMFTRYFASVAELGKEGARPVAARPARKPAKRAKK